MTELLKARPVTYTSHHQDHDWLSLNIGEPIGVRVGLVHSEADMVLHLKGLKGAHYKGRTLVLGLWSIGRRWNLAGLLDLAQAKAERVILTYAMESVAPADPLGLALLEADPARAIIGAMMSLRHGESLDVLWPAARGMHEVMSHIRQGELWRATWEAPENGEFHKLAQQPNV